MQVKQVFAAYSGKVNADLGLFKFCPFCGTKLQLKEKGGKQRPACPNCEFVQYRNPSPGVVAVIEKDGHVLLGKRAGSYGKGKWGLPVDPGFASKGAERSAVTGIGDQTG
jgi:8-oxo-dGTP diphosphatase